jgi:hypothetical protein
MRSLSISIKASGILLHVVLFLTMIFLPMIFLPMIFLPMIFLPMSAMGQVKATQAPSPADAKPRPEDTPLCSGAPAGSSAGRTPLSVNPRPHSVTLSWKAAVPASTSARDAIKGYYVYRSLTSQTYAESNRISESPLRGNHCVDITVESQKTYFYTVKAVTENGEQSGSSIEIKAIVPSP